MTNSVVVWTEPAGSIVPKSASTAAAIAEIAPGLTSRDRRQIVNAYESESFEMMAGFVLNKALSQLKRALASLGMAFVGEMLGRPDLDEDSVPTVSISNSEAIKLGKELGLINSTDAIRLGQHIELLAHFDNLSGVDAEYEEMTREEALNLLRTCVNAILGRENNEAPIEFKRFRARLESKTFKSSDQEIATLGATPYFFKKTTLSILLAGIKARSGAQFEHTLGNIVSIVPMLWPSLRASERWSVGQTYAEVVSEGIAPAVLALKKALTAVGGFDYVPETLRSETFSAAAHTIVTVHSSMNNFYNEPAAISALAKLGTTIPWPAFPVCMSAILAVRLGNTYGYAFGAQPETKALLDRLTPNQWDYYLNECLPGDDLVLQKLAFHLLPRKRWIELVDEFDLAEKKPKSKLVARILQASAGDDADAVAAGASRLLKGSGK
jgi:hypothetical protein